MSLTLYLALCHTETWLYHVLLSSWVLVIATCGSLECHSSWKTPKERYEKPPPERPYMVTSQKIYVNSQTAMKSL